MSARSHWPYALVLVGCSSTPNAPDGGADAGTDAVEASIDAPVPVAIFAERFGDGADQVAFGAAASSDGVVITGALSGSADFGGGALTSAGLDDVFVTKLDASGKHVFSKRFGDADEQWAEHVAVDASGNIAVVGSMSGTIDFGGGPLVATGGRDVFVAVFDASGAHRWSKSFGSDGTNEDGWSVAFDPSGDVLVTGGAEGAIDFGCGAPSPEGEQSIFVAKLDPKGACVFSRRVGDPEEQIGFAIASDAAGDVLVTGRFEGTIDFGAGPMTAALRDAFVAAWDPSGNILFSRSFGDPSGNGMAEGRGVVAMASGGVVVVGKFSGVLDGLTGAGDTDVFVIGLDAKGVTRFERRYGDATFQNAFSIAPDGADTFLASGDFAGALDFGSTKLVARAHDGWVARFDAKTGDATSAWSIGGGDVIAWSVAKSTGPIFVAGSFDGPLDFGGITLVSSGGTDVFAGALP